MNHELNPATIATYPRTSAMIEHLRESAPRIMASPIDWMLENRREEFLQRAERLITLAEAIHPDPADALVQYTVGYMVEQARFLQSGDYAFDDFGKACESVYDNEEVMSGFYLAGLLLTHAFWPVHFVMHDWFQERFVENLDPGGRGVEIGFGHGLYLAEILRRHPGCCAEGYDISQYSLEFATKLLTESKIAESRWRLQLGDVQKCLGDVGPFDWAIFAEVLEHIPRPDQALVEIAGMLKKGAPLYAVTVVDSNAIDHLYHFKSTDEVLDLFRDSGFEILDHLCSRVSEYSHQSDPTVNVSVICRRSS